MSAIALELKASDEYLRQVHEFGERRRRMGLCELKEYYWYHTIDLGDGLITPGVFDFRSSISAFQFPEDMSGMHVLDVGSATGFFAFEFERWGAHVTSVELPSLADLDRFPGQSVEHTIEKLSGMLSTQSGETTSREARQRTDDEVYQLLLEGPFRFCHRVLHSRVRRCYSTIYNLSAENLGRDGFDLIFIGDVLLHTLYPLQALAAVAPLCRGTLIIAQALPESDETQPAMIYVGGEEPERDEVSWWLPNKLCFIQLLKKLGFHQAADVGSHTVVLRPVDYSFKRTVLHASR